MIWFPLSSSSSSPQLLWLLLFILILCPFNSIDATPKPNILKGTPFIDGKSSKQSPNPTNAFFEVTKPIDVNPSTVPCKQLIFRHEFSSTDGKPQVVTNYAGPSSSCGHPHQHHGFSKIVLESRGGFRGTQDDAVFGVWIGGVELLRSSPAQGYNASVTWSARKDITRYSSLLLKKEQQKLVVFLRTVNPEFIGVYRIIISISFYRHDHKSSSSAVGHDPNIVSNKGLESFDESKLRADLILPISRNLDSENGLWFQIENSTDVKVKEFKIPRNAYRAVLEVYVSSHNFDQFWYSNYPPEFYNSNQLVDRTGNGPFRDVVITVDDVVAGGVWPYPLINDAGYDMWNPVVTIRSFDLPSYDVELTPFLGTLLDGGVHNLSFSVGNALNVWYINANLHLWLDHKSKMTKGKLVSKYNQPLDLSSTVRMKGLIGKSWVEAHRMVSSRGWVQSSYGNVTTHVTQNLSYTNYLGIDYEYNYYSRTIQQLISSNDSTVSFVHNDVSAHDHHASNFIYSAESMKEFSLMIKEVTTKEGEGDFSGERNVQIGYSTDEKMTYESSSDSKARVTNNLKDHQNGNSIWLIKNNRFVDVLEAMNQSYQYQKVDGESMKMCYLRNINTSNTSIVYDKEDWKC